MNKIDDEFGILELVRNHLRLDIVRSDESNSVYISLKILLSGLDKYEWHEISGDWISIPDSNESY